jgi:hypothetical protein
LQSLDRIVAGEKNTAVLALESLFSSLLAPTDYTQTTTGPAPLFLVFDMYKKSLVKSLSLNPWQTLAQPMFQRILPTIFQ